MLRVKKNVFLVLTLIMLTYNFSHTSIGQTAPTPNTPDRSSLDLPVGSPRSPENLLDPEEIEEDEPPKLYDEELPAEELSIIYVVDISGSMWQSCPPFTGLDGNSTTGNRLDRAKVEIIRSISALTENYTFNIISYHCAMVQWRPERANAIAPNKADASGWTMALHPGGGTGTGPATALALSDKDNFTVALLSDGWPGCGATGGMVGHLQTIVLSNTQGAKIHTFGISTYGAAEQFLRDIATTSGGVYYPVD